MQKKTRSLALTSLIKLRRKILDSWATEDEIKYPGIRFDSDEPKWRDGYATPSDHETPDFVKKDNDGWAILDQSGRE